jgi:hypothetical protein
MSVSDDGGRLKCRHLSYAMCSKIGPSSGLLSRRGDFTVLFWVDDVLVEAAMLGGIPSGPTDSCRSTSEGKSSVFYGCGQLTHDPTPLCHPKHPVLIDTFVKLTEGHSN